MTILFVSVVVVAAIWNVVSSIVIFEYLRKKGQEVSFIWLKALAPAYAQRYRKLTLSETGKVGSLFYHWIISINVALVSAIVAIVTLL